MIKRKQIKTLFWMLFLAGSAVGAAGAGAAPVAGDPKAPSPDYASMTCDEFLMHLNDYQKDTQGLEQLVKDQAAVFKKNHADTPEDAIDGMPIQPDDYVYFILGNCDPSNSHADDTIGQGLQNVFYTMVHSADNIAASGSGGASCGASQ